MNYEKNVLGNMADPDGDWGGIMDMLDGGWGAFNCAKLVLRSELRVKSPGDDTYGIDACNEAMEGIYIMKRHNWIFFFLSLKVFWDLQEYKKE